MQNQYTGDFGDFVKYGLLRSLSEGRQLGMAWYLRPNGSSNDGSRTEYLCEQGRWRHLDPPLFDALREIVFGGAKRSVARIQNRGLLPGARFSLRPLSANARPRLERELWRQDWFMGVINDLDLRNCDMVFADPDKYLYFGGGFDFADQNHWDYLPIAEAQQLADIFYHQNTPWPRAYGGQREEIRWCMERLPDCNYAFYSPYHGRQRTFFIVNADCEISARLNRFAEAWEQAGELIPA